MKLKRWAGLIVVVTVLLIAPRIADSCGPFLTHWLFATYHGPGSSAFPSGQVGVLRPHYWRQSLLLSYRILSDVPLTVSESVQQPPVTDRAAGSPEPWLRARREVPGLSAIATIDTYKRVPGTDYQFYLNCLGNAFESAASTLRERIVKWGARSPEVAEWVRAQDQVFANCSSGPQIPQELTSADPLLAADRRYQIAAAKFYAGQYDEAEAAFDRIASDAASPWHEIAAYLAARACIRFGTILKDDDKLRAAADRLRAIGNDPARRKLHPSAQGLLDFVQARLEPQQRLAELGTQLMQPGTGGHLQRVLIDYTAIWDRLGQDISVENSDVADWIAAFQAGGPASEKWRAKRTLPWLVAALAGTSPGDPAMQDLLTAAHGLVPDSPGYASATYYGILAQVKQGDLDAARRWADQALATQLPASATNLLRAERLRLARDWTEFLRFAPRTPIATALDGDASDIPLADSATKSKPVGFDGDAVQPLNQTVPLKLWMEASRSDLVPRVLQTKVAQAAWVRAVILGEDPYARTLAERLRQLSPDLDAELRGYLAERDPAAARFAAVFLMLRGPGLEPVLRAGSGRETPVLKRDEFRDNWWTLPAAPSGPPDRIHEALYDLYPNGNFGPTAFLPKEQSAAGEMEWAQLVQRAGNSVNYLCSETIAWAGTHPQDPRVPLALYLAVQATHYGPADQTSTAYSKQAFDLLHRRYPSSEWTKQTKYWY